ncbi:hypothetical protein KRR38_28800 [Novosphingobium sp. G106]|uniref:hypothetical protein n=1 Tax=Novosphingobium sp. G106 TaxID=2849500 RepID=UPI001C2D7A95|nr:hypothetical protein [Novosphingobium sp. G106]MBV1691568.1 hypothetical protein [Novosphingobium sp. G106]
MFKSLKSAGIVAALAVGAMTFTTTSAEARDHWRGRGDDTAAIAVGAGIIGLAVGAAIASNSDRGYYYGDGYYGRPRYYYRSYPRGYYYDRYPRRYYYREYRGWDRGPYRGWDRRYYRGW